ncbi:MAG: hypothetical protein WCO52_06565, partial [bacterium]
LEVFDDIPTTRIRARVRKYLDYYESDQWQDNSDKPFPVITFVCPNKRVRSHVSYFLASRVDEETGPEVTTVLAEEISSKGLGAVQAVR